VQLAAAREARRLDDGAVIFRPRDGSRRGEGREQRAGQNRLHPTSLGLFLTV
jgi:hypothetical protein